MTRVVASEGRLSEFLKKFLSFLVVVPGHPSHGPFYLISGLLKSIQRFGGWGHSGKNNSSNNSGSGSATTSAAAAIALVVATVVVERERVRKKERCYRGIERRCTSICCLSSSHTNR